MHVVHVVKRFGPVGGMERYVWELVHHLIPLGINVTVVCEKAFAAADASITVVELGRTRQKPRWVSMLRFSARVTAHCRQAGWLHDSETVIHSHERTAVHQITTFHGPPMAPIKRKKLWWLSPRLVAWLWLEKRELLRPNVQVLANSKQIQTALQTHYPKVQFGPIAWPAVSGRIPTEKHPACDVVFIGHEYHRKGLDRVIDAMEVARENCHLTLAVVGARQDSGLKALLSGREWIRNEPWVENINPSEWGRVLVHPARNEPYGMVVAEALASGIPALVSPVSGVADHEIGATIIPNSEPNSLASQILDALGETVAAQVFSWKSLAEIHLNIYSGAAN